VQQLTHPGALPVLVSVFLSRSVSVSLFAPTLPAISEALGTTYEGAGSLVGVLFVGYTIAVAVGGPLADRIGRRPLLVGGAAMNLLATLSVAFVPDLATARIAAFAYGVAGIGDLTATVLLAEAGGRGSGRLLSFAHGAFALGAVVVPLSAGAALEAGVSFRVLYAVAASVNLGLLAALFATPRLGSRGRGPAAAPPPPGRGVRQIAASPALAFGLASAFLYIAAEAGLAIWLPTLFRDRFDATATLASASVAAYWAAMFAGRIGLSRVVDRTDRGRLLAALGLAGAVACAAVLASPIPAVAFAGAVLAGLAMSACVPVIQSMVAAAFPREQGGAVLGALGVAIGAGGAFAPWAIGALADAVGGGAPGEGLATAMWMNAAALAGLAAVGPIAARACAARAEDHRNEPTPAPAGPGPGSSMTPTRDSDGEPT